LCRYSAGGVVVGTTVTAGAGTPAAVGLAVDLPAGALARAAGAGPGPGSGGLDPGSELDSAWAAHEGTPLSWGAMGETQSLEIARSLVEGAGGIFHVLPSLPPTVGRIEMWLPAAPAVNGEPNDDVDADRGTSEGGGKKSSTSKKSGAGERIDGEDTEKEEEEDDDAVVDV
jgi:hypothetical protein